MKRSYGFKIAATVVLGLTAFIWLIRCFDAISRGVPGGIQNMIVAIVMIILALLSWKWPLLWGIITAVLGVLAAVIFNLILPDIYIAAIPMFLMFGPMVIAGLLYIEADWTLKKKN